MRAKAEWESFVEAPDALPVTEEQRAELRRRLAEHERDPDAAKPWSEVRAELDTRFLDALGAKRGHHVLDVLWTRHSALLRTLVRYADDFVAMCRTRQDCERAKERILQRVKDRNGAA